MIKAVIFDVDGTLLDSVDQHTEAWKEAFQHFGIDVAFDRVRSQIGKGGDKLLNVFLNPEQMQLLGKRVEEYRAELFRIKFLPSCHPFPGVRELFESLHSRHVQTALGSSAKMDEIEVYKQILGITDLVDQTVSSDDVHNSKPDPDVVEMAREKLGRKEPDECCFVGDSPYDAEAATKAKTKMIGLLCGGFSNEDLQSAGASEIFLNPSDLLRRWSLLTARPVS